MELFCTAGRGSEDFVIEELNMKLKTDQIRKTDGKVHFQTEKSDDIILQLLNLKCVERLFIKIYHNINFVASNEKALNYLRRELFEVHWPIAVENLRKFKLTNLSSQQVEIEKEDESPQSKKAKTEAVPDRNKTTFRVSCKLAGKPSRVLTTLVSAGCMQVYWECTVCKVQLDSKLKKPYGRDFLSNKQQRNNHWVTSYRPGNIILDPMCGAGTILIEAHRSWKEAIYFGADNDVNQLKICEENIAFSKAFEINLIHCCVSELPFRDRTVDVIICDTPFGINHSSREGVLDLHPSMVTEINRITKVGARIVLLTSQALKEKLLKTVSKMCGLCLDAKAEVQKDTSCNEADTTNSVQKVPNSYQNDALSSRTTQWYLKCCKYLKLGETDSHVLSFLKQEIKK